jgi:hypothetical protein
VLISILLLEAAIHVLQADIRAVITLHHLVALAKPVSMRAVPEIQAAIHAESDLTVIKGHRLVRTVALDIQQ